jgi:hypothetical protein
MMFGDALPIGKQPPENTQNREDPGDMVERYGHA